MSVFTYTKIPAYTVKQWFGYLRSNELRQNTRYIAEDILGDPSSNSDKISAAFREIRLAATGKFYLDGGVDTYVEEVSSGKIGFITNGVQVLNVGPVDEITTQYSEDADKEIAINYYGYAGGLTRYRSVNIYNGKTLTMAKFDGTDRSLSVAGGISSGGGDKIKWKILSGTASGIGILTVAHGLTQANIRGVTGFIYNGSDSYNTLQCAVGVTSVGVVGSTSPYANQAGHIVVFYV
jgi:hypothetical protein